MFAVVVAETGQTSIPAGGQETFIASLPSQVFIDVSADDFFDMYGFMRTEYNKWVQDPSTGKRAAEFTHQNVKTARVDFFTDKKYLDVNPDAPDDDFVIVLQKDNLLASITVDYEVRYKHYNPHRTTAMTNCLRGLGTWFTRSLSSR